MITSQITKKYLKLNKNRVFQWDIFKDISFIIAEFPSEWEQINIPYWIVLTQDCDLLQDFNMRNENWDNNDKYLRTILVAPCYLYEDFCKWEHIIWYNMHKYEWKWAKKIINNDEYKRLHYLEKSDFTPEFVIDFKHFYTITREIIYNNYNKTYICSVSELYRENLSQRFTNFLWRIWLPEL